VNGQVVLVLSGRMAQDDIAELEALISSEAGDRPLVLDLKDVTLVGQDAINFLERLRSGRHHAQELPRIRQRADHQTTTREARGMNAARNGRPATGRIAWLCCGVCGYAQCVVVHTHSCRQHAPLVRWTACSKSCAASNLRQRGRRAEPMAVNLRNRLRANRCRGAIRSNPC
jgi:hypothetical protein